MLSRILLIVLILCFLIPGCDKIGAGKGTSGLKPGLNYMQPIKWRVTYRYRIRQINPSVPYLHARKWSIDPNIPTVGDGTCEVWFVGPREGEEVRDVKLIYTIPEPTQVSRDLDDDSETGGRSLVDGFAISGGCQTGRDGASPWVGLLLLGLGWLGVRRRRD